MFGLNPQSWSPCRNPSPLSQNKEQNPQTPASSEKLGLDRPERMESQSWSCITLIFLFFISAFNIVLNFGIAVTYPTLMSLGIVLSVPVNAGKLLWLSASVCKHTHASTHVHTRTHIYSCLPGTVFRFNLLYRKKPLG